MNYSFQITLANQSSASVELAEATFEAGCDDATMASRDGVVTLTFDRKSGDLASAIGSAINQLKAAGCEVSTIEILPQETVTA